MPLTLVNCSASRNAIKVLFSQPVDKTTAENVVHYKVSCPSIGETPVQPSAVTLDPSGPVVILTFSNVAFRSGDSVTVKVSNVKDLHQSGLEGGSAEIKARVRDRSRTGAKDVEEAVAYPILTEEVGYPPSPLAGAGAQTAPGAAGGVGLGLVAAKAVTDVLGWKANAADPKGFLGALGQSFTLTDVEGHIESKWTPRTYAVQTDLAGGITGAQASLYSRAKDALDQCIPLLDGLYPLNPEAEPEYVKALREMAKSQMNEIVKQLGAIGGPSVLRVETYFRILLGVTRAPAPPSPSDADQLDAKSTLGSLRDTFGIGFVGNPFSNSVEDEQDITNFRIIVDYMLSLWQSWVNNRSFFTLDQKDGQAFFGTQLVLISRQFSVIAESVNEVRFTLDSVFIGPSERQTLLLQFIDGTSPMFLEDVLQEVEDFATEEGPRLIRDGGRIAVKNNLVPVANSLRTLVEQLRNPFNADGLPPGFNTARVSNTIDDLWDQLNDLVGLITPVGRDVPPPEQPSLPPGGPGLPPKGGVLLFPPTLDFGEVQPGSSSIQTITIANFTSDTVAVSIEITGTGLFMIKNGPKNFSLGSMQTACVSIQFSPVDESSQNGTLTGKAGGYQITATLRGKGRSDKAGKQGPASKAGQKEAA